MPVAITQPADQAALEASIASEAAARAAADTTHLEAADPHGIRAAMMAPHLRPNEYIHAPSYGTGTQSNTILAGFVYYAPILIARTSTFDRVNVEVTTGGSADSTLMVGLYADDGAWMPGTLISDYGSVPADVVAFQEIVINTTLDPGWYWLAVLALGSVMPQVRWYSSGLPILGNPTNPSIGLQMGRFSNSGRTGLDSPASIAAAANLSRVPRFLMRCASVGS